ncbi:LamG domain-containing protein, partial [Roseomonas sp. NAR14]|nr:LamG domain-containing protein [Roseomonas acroporae]
MVKALVNRGGSANDVTADTLYAAFGKLNDNTDELYTKASDLQAAVTALQAAVGSIDFEAKALVDAATIATAITARDGQYSASISGTRLLGLPTGASPGGRYVWRLALTGTTTLTFASGFVFSSAFTPATAAGDVIVLDVVYDGLFFLVQNARNYLGLLSSALPSITFSQTLANAVSGAVSAGTTVGTLSAKSGSATRTFTSRNDALVLDADGVTIKTGNASSPSYTAWGTADGMVTDTPTSGTGAAVTYPINLTTNPAAGLRMAALRCGLNDSTNATWKSVKWGYGLGNSGISIPAGTLQTTANGGFSLGFWFKPPSAQAYSFFHDAVGGAQVNPGSDGGVYIHYQPSTGYQGIGYAAGTFPTDGALHYAMVNVTASAFKIYIDGVLKVNAALNLDKLGQNPLYIGKRSGDTTSIDISEVSLWATQRAATTPTAALTGGETGITTLWPLDNGLYGWTPMTAPPQIMRRVTPVIGQRIDLSDVKYVRKDRFTAVPNWRHQSGWPPRTVHANGMLDSTSNLFCHGYVTGSWDPSDMRVSGKTPAAWAGGSSYVPPAEAWPSVARLHTEGCAIPNWSTMQYLEGGPLITLGTDATMPGGFLKMTPRLMTANEAACLPAAMMSASDAPKYLGPAFNTFPYGIRYGLHATRMRAPNIGPGWPAFWHLSDFQDSVNEIDTNDKFGLDYRTSNQGFIYRHTDGS